MVAGQFKKCGRIFLGLILLLAVCQSSGDIAPEIFRKPIVKGEPNFDSHKQESQVFDNTVTAGAKEKANALLSMPQNAGASVQIEAQIYKLISTGGKLSVSDALKQIEDGTATLIGTPSAATRMNTWFKQETVHEIPFPEHYILPQISESISDQVLHGGRDTEWEVSDGVGALPGFPDVIGSRTVGGKFKVRPREVAGEKIVIDCELEQSILKGFVRKGNPIIAEKSRSAGGRKKRITLLENEMVDPVFESGEETVVFSFEGDSPALQSKVLFASSRATLVGDESSSGNVYQRNLQPFFVRLKASKIEKIKAPKQRAVRKGDTQIYLTSRFVEISGEMGQPNPVLSKLKTSGILSDSQFQLLIRELNQKKGVDLLSAPSVMIRDSQEGEIRVSREFIYPTKYDPSRSAPAAEFTEKSGSFPVTPAVPTEFAVKDVGVSLQVLAKIASEKGMIDLKLRTDVTEFAGYLNYGEPIRAFSANAWGKKIPVVLTENKVLAPVFQGRLQETSVRIPDGYHVCVGGFVHEDIQELEDKVPILGDLPAIGRLARKKVELRTQRRLYVFVRAQLMDPSGAATGEED